MKITVFTSNQPRHVSLIKRLCTVADEVFAIQECTTLFPGAVKDSIYNQSPVMKEYFGHVMRAEAVVFGAPEFLPSQVRSLCLKMGDISSVPLSVLEPALDADAIIVFGASYIKPPLVDLLVERRAVNIHMGVSPYYRGSSCNFWAMFDGNPHLVGATIHLLSRGLDSGDMLFHALPTPVSCDPFVLGMKAVESAHIALCSHLKSGALATLPAVQQDRSQEIRNSRYSDFTDEVARQYLANLPSAAAVEKQLKERRGQHALLNPVYA